MTDTAWHAAHEYFFVDYPPSKALIKALELIRYASTKTFKSGLNSVPFLTEMRNILGDALWREMKHVIKLNGGPDIPTHCKSGYGEKIPTKIKHFQVVVPEECAAPIHHENSELNLILARCFIERVYVIRETLLSCPQDWWIELLLNDLRSSLDVDSAMDEELHSVAIDFANYMSSNSGVV